MNHLIARLTIQLQLHSDVHIDLFVNPSSDFESEEREEIADAPTPTHAPALERIEEQSTHTPGTRKSTRKNLESQPVHLVILHVNDHKNTRASGLVDYQFEKLNFELYILYSRAE